MKLIRVAISNTIIIIAWYAIDLMRYRDYEEKKQIEEVSGDKLVLIELKVLEDASYKPLEVKITDKTQVTGLGPNSLFLNKIDDLKHGQKVRVWYNTNVEKENIAEKVVVSNFFKFNRMLLNYL